MEQIGKYAIVGQIGVGGFGVVYEGRDPFLKRRVAIKTCSSEEPEIRDRFFREAEIAGNLQHRNIVTVHDFGIQDGVPYLVQEYLTGEDLDRLVARREPLPPAQRIDILLQAAHGLEYAHAHGVIHRDVKPANIRLTDDGTVKIMDFGIAKLANVASHLTRTGMTVGTAAYLPPEQIRGTAVDHRADVFSFGVTAYELLTYQRPFVGKTISSLFWELLQREPPALSVHWPLCPPHLERVVMRCLAKDPAQRYAGFSAVIPELEAALVELQQPADREPRRTGEEPTAPHPPLAMPPAAEPPGVRPAAPAAAPQPPRPSRPTAHERFEAAVTAVRRLRPPETGGLLSEVEAALAGARAAASARRARELLAEGELEAAERELATLPDPSTPEVAALRGEVARARADRLLAQAAAAWQQGEPSSALALVDELLVAAPEHQDGLRLRQQWRAEVAERERARAQSETRRLAVAQAVSQAEALLSRGDVDAAESVVAAAQAALGSHQPLRDLRRRLALARSSAAGGAPAARPGVSTEAGTVGIVAASVAAARQRAEAASSAAPAPDGATYRPWDAASSPPAAGTAPPAAPATPFGTAPEGVSASAPNRTRTLVLLVGAVLLLLLLALLARALVSRHQSAPVATPTPAPSAAPSEPLGIGAQSGPAVGFPDRDAAAVTHPAAAFPAGVPRRRAEVTLDVLVDAEGRPAEVEAQPGTSEDPRLVAEAKRVALVSAYTPAVRNGAPTPQRITVKVVFEPPP